MKYIVLAIITPIIVLFGCSDDTIRVRKVAAIDKLQMEILEDSIYADTLTPNYSNPGYYIIRSEFTLGFRNTSRIDTVFGLTVESVKLFLSLNDDYLGIISFGEPSSIIAPGEMDTVHVIEVTGDNDIGEPHCDQAFYCEFKITDDTGGVKAYRREGYILECIP